MYQKLKNSIGTFDTNSIPKERKLLLDKLISYINNRLLEGGDVNLNFICTHNSRRSHLSQIWAQTMAAYFDIRNVECYSGGTESTAMFPVVGDTLIGQGFVISKLAEQDNPVYAIRYDSVSRSIIAFSKKYDDQFNPTKDYGAIMTCASADEGCPIVHGSDIRLPIRYDDPKVSDGTPHQAQTYLDRSIQIGTEMMYVFSQVENPS